MGVLRTWWSKVALLILLPLLFPTLALADSIAFTTDIQTVLPANVSDKITVQTRDDSGAELKVLETTVITLRSSSATGEFSSNATNWTPVTTLSMSRNTANRSFYYRDQTLGSHAITVDTVNFGTRSQTIHIGTPSEEDPDPVPETPAPSMPSGSSGANNSSTHSSGEELKTGSELTNLYVYAGRDRTGIVGVPIEMTAHASETKSGAALPRASLSWTFGDGSRDSGSTVSHVYNHPGKYVVMVRAWAGRKEAYTRVLVIIKDSGLRITNIVPGYRGSVTLENGAAESNLGGVLVRAGNESFKIPSDTILLPGSTITLPARMLGFAPTWKTKLEFPGGQVVGFSKVEETSDEVGQEYLAPAAPVVFRAQSAAPTGVRPAAGELAPKSPEKSKPEIVSRATTSKKVTIITKKKGLWQRAWGNLASVFGGN